MMNKDLILSIDNGTQSLKALIFNLNGQLVAKEQVEFDPYFSKKVAWAEQDPDVFWDSLCIACQRLFSSHTKLKERLAGLALTTQRATVINVDQDGIPLRPAILWLDQRKTYGIKPIGGWWGLLFKLTRLHNTIRYFQTEAEANWINTFQPDIWQKTHKYLLLSGYLTFKLIGEFVDSIGCQVGYIPFNYKKLQWAKNWDWRWQCLATKRDMLPKLIPPGETLGVISKSASQATGIPEGLPMIAAAADKACEVLGSGSTEPSIGCLSYGTAATINITHKKYIEPISLLPSYPSAIPNYYTAEVHIYRGYWMVNWFKKEFGHPEKEESKKNGEAAEVLFEKFLNDIPPCSMGLTLQPYWTPGFKFPGSEAKGAVIGFGDVHSRGHFYRSILEGIAYALREGKERIEKCSHIKINSLRISGGGSQSDGAMQLTADVFGLPTARPNLYETSGLGAAIDVAVGLGFYPDFNDAIQNMTHIGEVFEPNWSNYRKYDALYRAVYKKMYKRLKPLYKKIREITGYP